MIRIAHYSERERRLLQQRLSSEIANGTCVLRYGGQGSGNFGHEGRLGIQGGSSPSGTTGHGVGARGIHSAGQGAVGPMGGGSGGPKSAIILKEKTQTISEEQIKSIPKKFNRGNQTEALSAATRSSYEAKAPAFVFATYAGFQITLEDPEPPIGSKYFKVHVSGTTLKISLLESTKQYGA